MASARAFIGGLLKKADVEIGGSRPQDITVHDERLFNRVIRFGTMGLGEAYMDGWWDANTLRQYNLSRFLTSLRLDAPTFAGFDIESVTVVEAEVRPQNLKHRASLR
ncbi:MAG TPA: hypothetical protein PLW99_03245, partial [Candidatus Paceibacterota bacterium]|nr:hypothetical protein [Candidatus Paceibacterota bacterium]